MALAAVAHTATRRTAAAHHRAAHPALEAHAVQQAIATPVATVPVSEAHVAVAPALEVLVAVPVSEDHVAVAPALEVLVAVAPALEDLVAVAPVQAVRAAVSVAVQRAGTNPLSPLSRYSSNTLTSAFSIRCT